MGAFWVVAETRNLIYGEGNIWTSIVGYVREDADDLAVVPFRFPLEAVVVAIENSSINMVSFLSDE